MPNTPPDIDALLAEARSQDPAPGDAFLETALANAYAAAAALEPARAAPQRQVRSFWAGLGNGFGGWKAASALTASALAGAWIGYGDWQGITTTSLSGIAPSFASQIGDLESFDGIDAMLAEG